MLKELIYDIEAALRQLREVNYALDEVLAVAITDINGNIIFANQKFCETSKYSIHELLGQNHRIINSGYHKQEFFHQMWTTIQNGKIWRGDVRNQAKDGTIYWMDLTIVPLIDDNGKPYRYVSFRINITEQKKTEEILRRADKIMMIEQLASAVAHEIRNPLAAIQYLVALLEAGNEEDKKRMELITSELGRIDKIVGEFLLLAKPHVVSFRNNNLVTLIHQAVSLMNIPAIKKQITILTQIEDGIPNVWSDESQLKQVFINIIKNAIEAMPCAGNIMIEVKTASENRVLIRFTDEGVGVPQELLSNLGEPFFTTKKQGTGLGLMVCQKIIEAHSGTFSIQSEHNKGTTVEIYLPILGQVTENLV